MMKKLMFLLIVLLIPSFAVVKAQNTGNVYVLLHGAFQDASGWDAVIPTLEAAGNTVIAVQLPRRGDDTTPLGEITLQSYRDVVINVIEQQERPVILVGHSFGGMVISEVAEAIPDRIESLVYVAAYLPQNGDTLAGLASNDHYSLLGQEGNFLLAEDFTYAYVNPDIFASAFCPDCSEEQLVEVGASQVNEPLAPLNEPSTVTEANFGGVNKVYILTAEDVVVSPQLQAFMISRTPVDHVFALDTGHVPFITQPEALANQLLSVAAE